MAFIPVCEPMLAGNELKYVTEAVSTGWISSSGKYVNEFENNKNVEKAMLEHPLSKFKMQDALAFVA